MIVITNGEVIDPGNGREGAYDLFIDEEGRISSVVERGTVPLPEHALILDAAGQWVVPGLIDVHVHLREPGQEWKETIRTGSEAAVLGGFTTICAMPNTTPVNDCAEVTRFIRERGRMAGLARVLPIGSVSKGLKGEQMAPLSELRDAGCIAFSDDGEPVANAGMMRRALEWCLMLDAVISCHEEDKTLSAGGAMNESPLGARMGLKGMPPIAEEVMVSRDVELARYTGGRVHFCHISTARGVELVRRAKRDGIRVTAEVTPHHLILTEDAVKGYDTNAKMSPPLRGREDCDALIEGLADGTIDAVASDHAPHDIDSKRVEFSRAAMGILGLQTSLPILIELVNAGRISRKRAIESLTASPAAAFGIDAGKLSKGMRADIAVVNPGQRWKFDTEQVRSKSKNSPFLGRELTGLPSTVLVEGKVVVRGGELVA